MATYGGSNAVTDGLVLALDAANVNSYPGSGTTWGDLSGNANNGTLTNGPTFNSANGGSIVFDGVDDYASTSATTINESQTFSAWVSITAATDFLAGIVTQHNYAATANFGINYLSSNKLAASIGYTNGTREYQTKTTTYVTTINKIFNVALVYNSIENKIYWYINGSLDSSYILSATPKFTNYAVGIGRWDAGYNDYYFNGKIYSALIYNSALSNAEISQNYNAQKSRFGL